MTFSTKATRRYLYAYNVFVAHDLSVILAGSFWGRWAEPGRRKSMRNMQRAFRKEWRDSPAKPRPSKWLRLRWPERNRSQRRRYGTLSSRCIPLRGPFSWLPGWEPVIARAANCPLGKHRHWQITVFSDDPCDPDAPVVLAPDLRDPEHPDYRSVIHLGFTAAELRAMLVTAQNALPPEQLAW